MTHPLRIAALAALLALMAGCGVDGPPTRPEPAPAPAPGIDISGEGRIGVVTTL